MRNSRSFALAVVVLLVLSLPSSPALGSTRSGESGWFNRQFPSVERLVKQVGRALGIRSYSDGLTLPKP